MLYPLAWVPRPLQGRGTDRLRNLSGVNNEG